MTLEEAALNVATASQELTQAEATLAAAQDNITAKARAKNEAERVLNALLAGNGSPEPPPETFAERKAAMRDAIDRRVAVAKDAGITLGGMPIPTTADAQQDITSSVSYFQLDTQAQSGTVKLGGVYVTLPRATVFAISLAVGRYVAACLANAAALDGAALAADDDTELDAIDIEAGWPARVVT